MLPLDFPADGFILEYRADQHLLIGRWLRVMTLPELKAVYEALLTTAQTQDNCRHWLLDVRRRGLGDEEALRWFGQEFGPRLVSALGGPVFVAYFGLITQEAAQAVNILGTNIEHGIMAGAHYHYYNREDEALDWLHRQP